MNRLKKFLRDVVLTIAVFPLVALWLLVLTGMFSPESLIVFVMALREVDADQLAGLMRSAVHIWIALSIVLALARLAFGLGASSPKTATNQKGSQPCA
ncbi:hypothetical protein SAMN02744133_102485 [Thalassospira xiamenensis M-5 = DSM 17429]|uniref:Uncharacterized protein n=1 Tax=Thalassospira xiamenensis M-5 = DSM 17429 TaxID=1123366 RepID=A0AB72U7Y7_9PROT|nr:hypothetical protein [Thalassospira xiamenensis]AJD50310.1 hypothetical protein TH3_00920 [Thalassospira xiamenensis M-5 = DSM 17429]SIS81505.1 hypothetical protein SAMN02744133_102485 [Thalassospira xiamenensis M-5 = DSM 17429]